jgi:hypothetical protein
VANAITPIKRQVSAPYLTLAEFKNAPTALDYGNLVVGGNQQAQDAELSNAILRASSWIDQFCNQILGATNDTEQQRTRLRPDGSIRFHPKYFPIVALKSFAWGANSGNLVTAPDCSIAWLEEQQVIFPYASASYQTSSQGPLGFGFPSSSRSEVFIKYDYVNGYANTTTAASLSAGATSISVANGTGIVAGEMLTIYDGASTERVTVDSSYAFGSNTVPLTAGLLYAHNTGVSVSALPAAIKQAAILLTTAFLKIRGDASLTMAVTNTATSQVSSGSVFGNDVNVAQELLKPFRRIR